MSVAVARWDAGTPRAVAALVRHEIRRGLPFVLEALGVIAVLPLGAWLLGAHEIFAQAWYRELALLLAAPCAAALLGGAAVAGERAEGTLSFITTRAASTSQVLGAKLAVGGTLALLELGVVAALVRAWSGPARSGWLEALDTPADAAVPLGLLLTSCVFLLAYCASCWLADPLTAALGGALAGLTWALLAGFAPGAILSGSPEIGVNTMLMLCLPLLSGPVALALWLASRDGWRRLPQRWAVRAGTWSMLACALLPWALAPGAFGLARDQRSIVAGRGVVEPSPLLLAPSGRAAAFVAVPFREPGRKPLSREHGRAVIAFIGATGADRFPTVLPWGTRPIAWTSRGTQLVVEWPGGSRRVVDVGGRTHAPSAEEASLPPAADDASLIVREGRVLLSRGGEQVAVYPFVPGAGEP
jgi:hypothetical protein